MRHILYTTLFSSAFIGGNYTYQQYSDAKRFLSTTSPQILPGDIAALREPFKYETLLYAIVGTAVTAAQYPQHEEGLYPKGDYRTTHFAISLGNGQWAHVTPSGIKNQSTEEMSAGRGMVIFRHEDSKVREKITLKAQEVLDYAKDKPTKYQRYDFPAAFALATDLLSMPTYKAIQLLWPRDPKAPIELSSYCSKFVTMVAKNTGALSKEIPDDLTPKALEHILASDPQYKPLVCAGKRQHEEFIRSLENPEKLGIPQKCMPEFIQAVAELKASSTERDTESAYLFMRKMHDLSTANNFSFAPLEKRASALGFVGEFDPSIVQTSTTSFMWQTLTPYPLSLLINKHPDKFEFKLPIQKKAGIMWQSLVAHQLPPRISNRFALNLQHRFNPKSGGYSI